MDLVDSELLLSFRRDPGGVRMVGHGKGAIRSGGLQKPQEDHRSWAERMSEDEVLASLFVPFELGLFHEEQMVAIPSRHFDRVGIDDGMLDGQKHRQPPQMEIADALPGDFVLSR